ncbi:MAG: porin [Arenicella sp.]
MSNTILRKTKISLAVLAGSAVLAAPVQASDIDLSLSGVVQAYAYLSDDNLDDDGLEKGERIAAGDVRFHVNASKKVGDYTGYASYRIDADGLSGTELTSDSITVGLKGSFGDLAIGEVTKVAGMGELANDMHGFNSDSEQHIGYSNNFGPVKVAVTYSPENNQDQTGLGVQYSAGGITVGAGYDTGKIGDETLGDESGLIVGAKYAFGSSSIAVHSGKRDTFKVTAVEGKTSFSGWDLAVTFSSLDNDSDITRVQLSTSLAKAITWSTRYETKSPASGEDTSFIRTGFELSF